MKNKEFEITGIIVGTITLVLGIINKDTEIGYLLNLIAVLSWSITIFLFALDRKLTDFSNLIIKGG